MPECKTCKHKGINTHICDECASYYSMYEKKIVTNADRIRSMTDEELAEFFASKSPCDYYCNYRKKCCSEISCKQGILEWLQSEAE